MDGEVAVCQKSSLSNCQFTAVYKNFIENLFQKVFSNPLGQLQQQIQQKQQQLQQLK